MGPSPSEIFYFENLENCQKSNYQESLHWLYDLTIYKNFET